MTEPAPRRPLAEIAADIRALPLSLPTPVYRRELERLNAEWKAENLRLFDAAVAPLNRAWQELMEQCDARGW